MIKRVLLVVHINTFFIEMFNAGLMLKDTADFQPVFYFSISYSTVQQDIDRCLAAGLDVIDFQGRLLSDARSKTGSPSHLESRGMRQSLKEGLPQKLVDIFSVLNQKRHRFVYQWRRSSLWYQYRFLKQRRRELDTFFSQVKGDILILGSDMVGYDTSVYIQAAHADGILVVIISSVMDNGQAQAESYAPDPKHSLRPLMNRLAGWLYPHWVWEWRGKNLIRMPWGRVLAMEWLGLAPPLPWVACSGAADTIAVESNEMIRYYTEAGLPREQMVNIGSLTDDVLAAATQHASANKAALYQELGLPEDLPMLLCALPPDQLYMLGGRPDCEFKTYPDLVEFWMRSLAAVDGWNIVIALHPSVSYEELHYIEDWGAKIARKPTAELVPMCDLYVTSVSSTIRWAIACGKPVVNYDVYKYYYVDFMHVKGVLYTEDQDEFIALLEDLTMDEVFFQQTAALQQKAAPDWGFLDGRSGQRMIELLDSLIEKYKQEN